jgi:hypothetical protein
MKQTGSEHEMMERINVSIALSNDNMIWKHNRKQKKERKRENETDISGSEHEMVERMRKENHSTNSVLAQVYYRICDMYVTGM